MTQPAKVQEPSMEEILASIRRIIADDETKPADLANTTGIGAGPVVAAVEPPPRVHNVAAVASQPVTAPVGTVQSREGTNSMLAGLDKAPTGTAQEADVFDLTDDMAVPTTAPAFRKVEPKDDLEFADAPPPIAERRDPPPSKPVEAPAAASASHTAEILSATTASAVESAFNSLASTVLSTNSRTLEDLVREMMRPMLKNWLDDNLPSLVERIVKAEIERVARGR